MKRIAMSGEQITPAPDFELLIAQAGLTKTELAHRAGITRMTLYRALYPERAGVRGTLRATSAWSLARVYAEHAGIELHAAFALLFYVDGHTSQKTPTAVAPGDVTEDRPVVLQPAADPMQPPIVPSPVSDDTSLPIVPPVKSEQELRLEQPQDANTFRDAPMAITGVRLDAATARMLEALMEDEERSTKSEMIRLLIRRAYRARFAKAQQDVSSDTTSVR